MGDEAYDHVETRVDPDTGAELVTHREERSYDPATAHKALTSIGQHKDVQAFAVTVEHNHTHRLEQALARRGKQIEAAAEARTIEHAPQAAELVAPH